jgi:hypothetical protein
MLYLRILKLETMSLVGEFQRQVQVWGGGSSRARGGCAVDGDGRVLHLPRHQRVGPSSKPGPGR